MNAQDLEQQARELLAAEYERDGKAGSAEHILTRPLLPNKARAVRAIVAALRQQPVVDDARMARALEWVRALAKPCSAEEREMLANIEEAIAAYDPNCGARTVRVVDDGMREDAERYRWLRENAGAWEVSKDAAEWTKCETGEKFRPRVYFTAFSTGYGGMPLDDALDTARAQGVES